MPRALITLVCALAAGVAAACATPLINARLPVYLLVARWSPEVLFFVETEEPLIAFTIDDGPDPVETPMILDVLARYQAHATFFVITSNIPGNEDIMRRLVNDGHEIGNHFDTQSPAIGLNEGEFERRLLETHRILSQFAEMR